MANDNPTTEARAEKPRIALLVLRDDPNDGRLARQYDSLVTAGYNVVKFPVFADRGSAKNSLVQFFSYRLRRRYLTGQIAEFDPQLLISHEPEALAVAGHFLKGRNLPHIFDAHEFYDAQRGVTENRKAWLRKNYRRHAGTVDALITVSPGLIDLYARTYPELPAGILVANASRVSKTGGYDGRLHRETGVGPSTKILLYHGGLWHERGLEDVYEASALLPSDWITVFMGYGPLLDQFAQNRQFQAIPAKPQAELLDWIAGATLGVIPYPDHTLNHVHCLPNKLWEFPNAGVPIVARDLVDMSQVIRRTGIGVVFPGNGTGVDIANTVTQISDEGLQQLKGNCREFSKQENWLKYEKIYLDLVSRLLAESKTKIEAFRGQGNTGSAPGNFENKA